MSARVVAEHPVAGALQGPRAHHHIAARRGESVQQHDRRTVAALLSGQAHAVGGDAEFAQRLTDAHVACSRTSSAERSGRSQKNRWPTPSKVSRREPPISDATMRPFSTGMI